jgi:hypothetical protein
MSVSSNIYYFFVVKTFKIIIGFSILSVLIELAILAWVLLPKKMKELGFQK